ncbi:Nif3-like dinuclear metal center hexameric protein [Haliangium sp.]|uniref:Nif3-like dinuclear metal center hexameric protein n=1 Tax=Haliangium sp. TaxID=2663208 RepID=UPI003D110913
MKLSEVLAVLRRVAPEPLAEPWDKVGLQVGREAQQVRRALLCIDLSEAVMAEAVARKVNLIVSYHPPIFEPLRSLTDSTWKERVITEAVRRRIAIYSPHTALDAVRGGLTDWLCDGLGEHRARVAISPRQLGDDESVPAGEAPGAGRIHALRRPVGAPTLVRRVKQWLGLDRLKVAAPPAGVGPGALKIESIAVCPGAGGSLFERCPGADAYLTGEMQHHQVLDLSARGRVVILAGHSNSERPYLPFYRDRLVAAGGTAVDWAVSESDAAPMTIM